MIKKTIKKTAKQVLPPFVSALILKVTTKKSFADWHRIEGGGLTGREIFIDGTLHKEFVEGTYDKFFFDYLSRLDLHGKTVFDIGAHIGFHAMTFAQLVGDAGSVRAFEPNTFNRERLQLNLTKNPDLAKRIELYDVAVSDCEGEIEFNFSSNVDDGRSSGSFISGSHTPSPGEFYETIGFNKVSIKTVSLDQVSASFGIQDAPYLIKIDVEGAENLVLDGGVNLIRKYKPIILMEIHSIFNMLKTCEFFGSVDYEIELLKEENDGRCFIAATAQNNQ